MVAASNSRPVREWVTWEDGFLIHGVGLCLDPRRRAPIGFASDAFGEALAKRLIATPDTVRFLRRHRSAPSFLPSPYGRTIRLGQSDLRLLPAGGLPAPPKLRYRGATVLYARRILPEPSGLAVAAETPRADVVLLDVPGPDPARARGLTVAAIGAWPSGRRGTAGAGALRRALRDRARAGGASGSEAGAAAADRPRPGRLCAAAGVNPARQAARGRARLERFVLLPWEGGRPSGQQPSGRESRRGAKAEAMLAALRSGRKEGRAHRARTAVVHDARKPCRKGSGPRGLPARALGRGVGDRRTCGRRKRGKCCCRRAPRRW